MALSFKGGRFRDANGRFISPSRGLRSSIARKQFRRASRKRKKKVRRTALGAEHEFLPDQPGFKSAPLTGPEAFPTEDEEFFDNAIDILDTIDDPDHEDDYDADD